MNRRSTPPVALPHAADTPGGAMTLSLAVDGQPPRHLLDVTALVDDADQIAAATLAASHGLPVDIAGERLPVFDMRTVPGAAGAAGTAARPDAAACLLVATRGTTRLALIVEFARAEPGS
jgi:hypothetical protein